MHISYGATDVVSAVCLATETVAAIFMALLSIGTLTQKNSDRISVRCTIVLSISVALLLLVDASKYSGILTSFDRARNLEYVSIDFMLTCCVATLFHYHQFFYCHEETNTPQKRLYLGATMLTASIVIWLIGLPNNWFYLATNSEQGYTFAYLFAFTPIALLLINDLVYAFSHRRTIGLRASLAFIICTISFFIAAFLHSSDSSIILHLDFAFSALVIYMLVNTEINERLNERENDLAQHRFDVALSQIQPHFLYNSLNSIFHLIDLDSERAKQAVSDFSDYLRMNLSTVSDGKLIPFETELKHTQTYLKLEQMRFGDDLQVEYDIQASDFEVPPLCIQPLAENAVKHGICKREDGGTLTIASKKVEGGWEVVVHDDGVGFDPQAPTENTESTGYVKEHAHIGIHNTRERLEAMCQADLSIESTPDVGTTARIFFPERV
jgi:two-component system, LytTR family, sensor kinase